MAKSKNNETTNGKEVARPVAVPAIRGKDGSLLTLKRKDFPASKEGKIAYFKYQSEKYLDMAKAVVEGTDPIKKKERKIQQMRERLARLENEVADDKAAKTPAK